MTELKALIVDDERPARERLRRLLQPFDDIVIAGEAEDGEAALQAIEELKPDVVFLDIQMPGCDGLEVAASIGSPGPRIVFCTAFDQYAVDAFELHAVDYLLKPVNRARLEKAVTRLREQHVGDPGPARRAADAVGASGTGHPQRFIGKKGPRFYVIPQDDVFYFSSEDGQTRLTAEGQHYWMQPTLAELEARIDPERFFRISRSALVQLRHVREIVPGPGGHGDVRMADGAELSVSRRRFRDLLARLGAA